MRRFLFSGLALVALATASQGQSPSFNCDSARSDTEVAICRDRVLAQLDSDHELLFSRVLAAADRRAQARLQRDYPAWQRFRNLCGADRPCIARRYEARIGELTAEASPLRILEAPGVREETRPAAPLDGPFAVLEVPDLRILGRVLDTGATAPRRLTNIESIAVLATQGADPAPEADVATVLPDGTIRKPLSDGRIAFYNPVTGDRGYIEPNGAITRLYFMEVQPDDLPALPSDYSGWSTSVSDSMSGLVGNLLTVPEAQTLQTNAPPDFFQNLDFQLRILAFITG